MSEPAVHEFLINFDDLSPDLMSMLTDEIAQTVNKKTPSDWLIQAGDTIKYELMVRLTHGRE